MVESVNGTPAAAAARAARISPSACCMPVRPTGRERHRHADGLPDHGAGERAVRHVDGDALAQMDALEVGLVGAIGALGPGARVRRSRRTSCGTRRLASTRRSSMQVMIGSAIVIFSSRRADAKSPWRCTPCFPAEAGEMIKRVVQFRARECGFFNARRRQDPSNGGDRLCQRSRPGLRQSARQGSRPRLQPNGNGVRHDPTRSARRRCARCGSAPASHASASMRTYRSGRARLARG